MQAEVHETPQARDQPIHSTSSLDWQLQSLKRKYLTLLPPPQVIEICLTFEPHVPQHIKSSVWPVDIGASIAALESPTRAPQPSTDASQDKASTAPPPPPSPEKLPGSDPNDGHASTEPAGTNNESKSATSSVQPSTPFSVPQPSQQLYHHHPYPPLHQTTHYASPHAPFPSYLSHPHAPMPPPRPPNTDPQPSSSRLSQLAVGFPHLDPPPLATEDLPSYEEMIVEALMDSDDPEGCMPKTVFNWMATHYPLQSNFRPSASQALQKAFKRGRLEKTSGGKYHLNASWGGGRTSRRATRRPQSQAVASLTGNALPPQARHQPISPPFTRAPLNRAQSDLRQGYPPYLYPISPAADATKPQRSSDTDGSAESDAWRAAHTILTAINFGDLGKTNPNSDTTASEKTGDRHVSELDERAKLQAHLALLAAQLSEIAQSED